ncbi:hypothetical protein TIFTF001_023733 [Ficus carica]|uniref:Uncharacterized protein n=1 Tax=Ficus carica TaxID=3494 RepID=A0AA88DE27_FICCA|nr:hypothetical protein TIFTF001_023733 [Ficus carica]
MDAGERPDVGDPPPPPPGAGAAARGGCAPPNPPPPPPGTPPPPPISLSLFSSLPAPGPPNPHPTRTPPPPLSLSLSLSLSLLLSGEVGRVGGVRGGPGVGGPWAGKRERGEEKKRGGWGVPVRGGTGGGGLGWGVPGRLGGGGTGGCKGVGAWGWVVGGRGWGLGWVTGVGVLASVRSRTRREGHRRRRRLVLKLIFEPLHSKPNLVYRATSRWQTVLAYLLPNVPCLRPSSPICSFPVAPSSGIPLSYVTIGLSTLSKPGLCFLAFRIEYIRFPMTVGGFLPPRLILESSRGTWCLTGSVHRTPGIGTTDGQCCTDWGPQSKLEQKVSLPTIFEFGNHRTEPLLPVLIRLHRPCTPPPARTR